MDELRAVDVDPPPATSTLVRRRVTGERIGGLDNSSWQCGNSRVTGLVQGRALVSPIPWSKWIGQLLDFRRSSADDARIAPSGDALAEGFAMTARQIAMAKQLRKQGFSVYGIADFFGITVAEAKRAIS